MILNECAKIRAEEKSLQTVTILYRRSKMINITLLV